MNENTDLLRPFWHKLIRALKANWFDPCKLESAGKWSPVKSGTLGTERGRT
ncbi:unnamed protein product [Fusarium venenatum]|uniref:Uncharacterized protein n=1 Tax=Fusarium venenatum TaxID=56646 RepID=A0A2L2SYP1_9HYPO|nr:uncharacterized protein FVRRES_11314 [Fusarium venenatum]CEI38623.1 unnamed protein product [Fusarium venenatum]